MRTKVGAPVFTDPYARCAVAVPSAIVITLLCLAFLRWQPPGPMLAERTPAATIVLEHPLPTPRPTPLRTPPPTPPPPVAHVTPAPVPQRAAPRIAHPSGGGHAAPRPQPHAAMPSVVVAGTGGGAGTGSGSGEGAGDAGASGNGTGGTGSGSVNADAPCGYVELTPFQAPDRRGSLTYEHVSARVTYPDGHQEDADFPYAFVYADPANDPWSKINLPIDSFPTHVQPPPAGADTNRYPDVIRYVLDHTRPDGTTVLQECPGQR